MQFDYNYPKIIKIATKHMVMKVLITLFFILTYNIALTQTKTEINDIIIHSLTPINNLEDLNLKDLNRFVIGLDTMQIIGIGEATHSTKEFIDIRSDLSKILIREKGFKTIFTESSFGDTYEFDRLLNTEVKNIDSLMKERLFSIYQTEEYRNFFSWIQEYNSNVSEKNKVRIVGIDFALIAATANILKKELKSHSIFIDVCDTVLKQASFQDSIWVNMNKKDFKYNMKDVVVNGVYMFSNLQKIKKLAADNGIHLSTLTKKCIMNIESAAEPFYSPQLKRPARSRDELMSQFINEELKVNNSLSIIWAHNAHIAYLPVKGGAGGMGQFIKKEHPGYFSLATGTAFGSYNATLDKFNNNHNVFAPYSLNKPIKGSWEDAFGQVEYNSFYFNFDRLRNKSFANSLRFRVIGYGVQAADDGDYTRSPINDLFDGLIFIKTTNEAKILN